MKLIDLIIAAFATWRIANFLANESGPGDIGGWLRRHLGVGDEGVPVNVLGELVICTWCNSFWIGMAVAAVWIYSPAMVFYGIFLPFTLSGATMLIGRFING